MVKKYILTMVVFLVLLVASFFVFKAITNKNSQEYTNIRSNQGQFNADTLAIEGLKIEVLRDGQGRQAKESDNVQVHYLGVLEDGTKFDSSYDRSQPFEFVLGQGNVIEGWEKGVLGMMVGEKRRLTIQPELGYGAAGVAGSPIGPNAVLIFEVELLAINP